MLLREDRKPLFSAEQIEMLDKLRFSNDIITVLDYKICRVDKALDEVTKQWLVVHKIMA